MIEPVVEPVLEPVAEVVIEPVITPNHRIPSNTNYTGIHFDACVDGKVNMVEDGKILYSIPGFGHNTKIKSYFETVYYTKGKEKTKELLMNMSAVLN